MRPPELRAALALAQARRFLDGPDRRWRATAAKLKTYGIREEQVFRLLGRGFMGRMDDGKGPLSMLLKVSDLPHVNALLAKYRAAIPEARTLGGVEARRLLGSIKRLRVRRDRLRREADRLKLGKGRAWDVPPAAFWNSPPAELKGRYAKMQSWAWYGDAVVRVYDLLAPRIPPQRRRGLVSVKSVTFNQRALDLTAEVITNLWGPVWLSRPLNAQDVKNRLLSRRRRAAR